MSSRRCSGIERAWELMTPWWNSNYCVQKRIDDLEQCWCRDKLDCHLFKASKPFCHLDDAQKELRVMFPTYFSIKAQSRAERAERFEPQQPSHSQLPSAQQRAYWRLCIAHSIAITGQGAGAGRNRKVTRVRGCRMGAAHLARCSTWSMRRIRPWECDIVPDKTVLNLSTRMSGRSSCQYAAGSSPTGPAKGWTGTGERRALRPPESPPQALARSAGQRRRGRGQWRA